MRETKAIYPGSFDPITNGHLDLIKRSLEIFKKLTIAIVVNPHKKPLFTVEERMEMIKRAVRSDKRIVIKSFDGLLVDFAKREKGTTIVRGLRAISDFEYEFQMALMNRKLYKDLHFVYMMPSEKYTYLSSSMTKEIGLLGGDIRQFAPSLVVKKLAEKAAERGRQKRKLLFSRGNLSINR